MTAADPAVLWRLVRETANYRLNRSLLDYVNALELESQKCCISVLQERVLTDPSRCHTGVSIAIFFGTRCSCETVEALFLYAAYS